MEIMEVMAAKGVEPNVETFLHLLCCHARTGNIEKIRKIFSECEEKEIYFFDKHYFEVLYALALSNHTEYVDEILAKIKKLRGYYTQARLCILRYSISY